MSLPSREPVSAMVDTESDVPTIGGRPGVDLAQARTAVDTWVARTGRLPSTRQLRTALGDTGSLSTLGRHLQTIRAERLIEGETPEHGSAEDIALKAMKGALKVLASDAAEAAESMVTAAEKTADERVLAATGLQARAEAHAGQVEQEREHALGQVAELHDRVRELQQSLVVAREELATGRQRETTLAETINELEHTLGSLRTERDRLAEGRQSLTQERDELRAEVSSLRLTQQQQQTALVELRAQLAAELDARDAALVAQQALNARDQTSLSTAREELSSLRSAQAVLEQRASSAEVDRDRLLSEQRERWEVLMARLSQSDDDPPQE